MFSQQDTLNSQKHPFFANRLADLPFFVSVALPAEPRGEKNLLFFVQILGGEKLLKFGEKWAVKNF